MKIPKETIDTMYAQSCKEYPNECCGVIIGREDIPKTYKARPCANIQGQLKELYPDMYQRDADTGYFLDPKELLSIMNEISKTGLEIVGFYHSHPNHEAYWSAEDHRAAMFADTNEPSFPKVFHFVVSVYEEGVRGAAIFKWNESKMEFNKILSI